MDVKSPGQLLDVAIRVLNPIVPRPVAAGSRNGAAPAGAGTGAAQGLRGMAEQAELLPVRPARAAATATWTVEASIPWEEPT